MTVGERHPERSEGSPTVKGRRLFASLSVTYPTNSSLVDTKDFKWNHLWIVLSFPAPLEMLLPMAIGISMTSIFFISSSCHSEARGISWGSISVKIYHLLAFHESGSA